MLLSLPRKLIFVHVYKTGGLSVAEALRANWKPKEVLGGKLLRHPLWPGSLALIAGWRSRALELEQHASAREIRDVIPAEIFNACFKFAFVRNPWSLQLSVYRHIMRSPTHHQHAIVAALPHFNAYIKWLGSLPNGRHRVQCDFVMDRDGTPILDFIGRFEHLAGDFARIAARLGIPARLPHLNRSEGDPDFRKFYTPASRDIVGDLYRTDLEAFGYEFEKPAPALQYVAL